MSADIYVNTVNLKYIATRLLRSSKWGFLLLPLVLVAGAEDSLSSRLAYDLATRYTPYAAGSQVLDLDLLAAREAAIRSGAWWHSPQQIRSARAQDDLPLAGLRLAIDAGHIGGAWAHWEWRNFRMAESDAWVREGELVLEVSQRVRAQLSRLGAEVTLLRESCHPLNPKTFLDYWELAAAELPAPPELTLLAQVQYAEAIRNRAIHLAIVTGEIAERARLVNEVIQPDALLSLHINAAAWPAGDTRQLVDGDHAHVLIFGCLSASELARQQAQLEKKLLNGSGPIEASLGAALASSLASATKLPASDYKGRNAIRFNADAPYLWARNLMLLRLVDCPSVLLEPYIANSHTSYARLQKALKARALHQPLPPDDILIEYTEAVVAGILSTYGPSESSFD
jgi:N-acetylmuramoyl-L-alanine amidase